MRDKSRKRKGEERRAGEKERRKREAKKNRKKGERAERERKQREGEKTGMQNNWRLHSNSYSKHALFSFHLIRKFHIKSTFEEFL